MKNFLSIVAGIILCCAAFISPIEANQQYSDRPVVLDDTTLTTPVGSIPEDYPVRLVSVEIDPDFKDFMRPRDKGWLGSDVAYSIPLSPSRILWLYGDTLVGEMYEGKRADDFEFIHNSIGIQDTSTSFPGTIEYYWGTTDGKSTDFFPPTVDKHYVDDLKWAFEWPTMGMLLGGELFIYTYRIETGMNKGFAMPTTLIRISNPLEHPDKWNKKYFDLGLGSSHQGFHTALYIKQPYVYFLGFDDSIRFPLLRRTVLARAKIEDIIRGGLGDVYEFWVRGDNAPYWSNKPENLVPLFKPGVTESNIQYIPEWNFFISFTYYPTSPDIYITVAPELTGPWSTPVSIYKVPEHKISIPITSYAVRSHPEFSTKPGELIISYATNTHWDTKPLFTNEGAEIYFPRFIRVQLELNKR